MKTCSVVGCGPASRLISGMCSMHYQRSRKYGTTDPRKTPTTEERFWAKVNKTETCWIWVGALYSNGYGHFGLNASRGAIAHRFAWEQMNGKIPGGKILDHTCHQRACVNPSHLRIATQKQNIENMGVLRRDNTSGVRGVHRHSNGRHWVARVEHFGVTHSAGLFLDLDEAAAAVIALRNKLFTHNDLDRRLA